MLLLTVLNGTLVFNILNLVVLNTNGPLNEVNVDHLVQFVFILPPVHE